VIGGEETSKSPQLSLGPYRRGSTQRGASRTIFDDLSDEDDGIEIHCQIDDGDMYEYIPRPGLPPGAIRPPGQEGPLGDTKDGEGSKTNTKRARQQGGSQEFEFGDDGRDEFDRQAREVPLEIDQKDPKPWTHPQYDPTAWFNFGFSEHSFKEFLYGQIAMRMRRKQRKQVQTFSGHPDAAGDYPAWRGGRGRGRRERDDPRFRPSPSPPGPHSQYNYSQHNGAWGGMSSSSHAHMHPQYGYPSQYAHHHYSQQPYGPHSHYAGAYGHPPSAYGQSYNAAYPHAHPAHAHPGPGPASSAPPWGGEMQSGGSGAPPVGGQGGGLPEAAQAELYEKVLAKLKKKKKKKEKKKKKKSATPSSSSSSEAESEN